MRFEGTILVSSIIVYVVHTQVLYGSHIYIYLYLYFLHTNIHTYIHTIYLHTCTNAECLFPKLTPSEDSTQGLHKLAYFGRTVEASDSAEFWQAQIQELSSCVHARNLVKA